MVTGMIGGAVKAALEAGASAEMIAFAFRRAMKGERDWHDTEAFSDFTYESTLEAIEGHTARA